MRGQGKAQAEERLGSQEEKEEAQEQGQGAAEGVRGAACGRGGRHLLLRREWLRAEAYQGGAGQQEAAGEDAQQTDHGQGTNYPQGARGEVQRAPGHTHRALRHPQSVLDEVRRDQS